MKFLAIILAILAAVLVGLQWVPAFAAQSEILSGVAFGCAVLLIGTLAVELKKVSEPRKPTVSPVTTAPKAHTAGAPEAEGVEAIGLLSALQENGRLVDFLMDDITSYPDAKVGAAARVVHQGCRSVLDRYFAVSPATESAEGATISVPVSYRGDEYKLTGSLSGELPFTGRIVHPGWKTASVKLPQVVAPAGQLPNIAPTEVEVKG